MESVCRGLFQKTGLPNSELMNPEMERSEFSVPEQLIWISSINSEYVYS